MAAGDVAGLVGEHADHLVRRIRLHDRAGIDEDAPAVGDEGVEGAAVDDHDLDVLLRQPGRLQERLGVFAQQLLDLGVAHDRGAAAAARWACAGAAATIQWLAAIASETATATGREGRLRVAIVGSAKVMRIRSSRPGGLARPPSAGLSR